MALPLAVPLIQTGVGLAQGVSGFFRKRNAEKAYEENEAPSLFDSKAYSTAEGTANLAYRQMQEGLPEESRRLQEDYIGRAGAAAMSTTGSLRSGIAGIPGLAQSMTDSYRTLAMDDARQRIENRGNYFSEMNDLESIQKDQAERDYGLFLNDQAKYLAEMTGGQKDMNNMMGQFSEAGSLLYDWGMTSKELGGGGNF